MNWLKTILQQIPVVKNIMIPVKSINPDDALGLIGVTDTVFVDVRESSEHETSHIPNAVLMPYRSGVLSEKWNELPNDKQLVVYCQSGVRSVLAVQFLTQKGFTQLLNLQGGFSAYSRIPGAILVNGSGK